MRNIKYCNKAYVAELDVNQGIGYFLKELKPNQVVASSDGMSVFSSENICLREEDKDDLQTTIADFIGVSLPLLPSIDGSPFSRITNITGGKYSLRTMRTMTKDNFLDELKQGRLSDDEFNSLLLAINEADQEYKIDKNIEPLAILSSYSQTNNPHYWGQQQQFQQQQNQFQQQQQNQFQQQQPQKKRIQSTSSDDSFFKPIIGTKVTVPFEHESGVFAKYDGEIIEINNIPTKNKFIKKYMVKFEDGEKHHFFYDQILRYLHHEM